MMVAGRVSLPDGQPLPTEVLVSDGSTVVSTDRSGRFSIETTQETVWIVIPSQFECRGWHQPSSSYIEFVVEPAWQATWPVLGHVTDLHICDPESSRRGPKLGLEEFADSLTSDGDLLGHLEEVAVQCDLLVATGDLTDHGTATEYLRFNEVRRSLSKPMLVVPGNHDHYGMLYAEANEKSDSPVDVMLVAFPQAYERSVEPRWWARWFGELLIVGLDWFTHRLGIDPLAQERWIDSLLSHLRPGTHVVILSHDVFPRTFYDNLEDRWPAVQWRGSLSGHWHVSRAIAYRNSLHLNTAPASFAGLDLSPAQARLVRWDSTDVASKSVTLNKHVNDSRGHDGYSHSRATITWRQQLRGSSHLSRALVVDDHAIACTSSEEYSRGWITAVDLGDGRKLWESEFTSQFRSGAAVYGDTVVAVGVGGLIVGIDRLGGTTKWQQQTGDPFLRALTSPIAVAAGYVLFGDLTRFEAVDISTGETVWCRDDIGRAENLLTYGEPVVTDEHVIVPFGGPGAYLTQLELHSGATCWIYSDSSDIPTSQPLVLDDVVLVAYSSGYLRFHSLDSGSAISEIHCGGSFPTLFAAADEEHAFVALADGRVMCIDPRARELVWDTRIACRELGLRPYCRDGSLLASRPVITSDGIVALSADGCLSRIDRLSGQITGSCQLKVVSTDDLVPYLAGLIVTTRSGQILSVAPEW